MVEIKTFFRTCPSCSKRFEIRLESKKLVDSRRIREEMPMNSNYFAQPGPSVLVGEAEPVVIDIEEFQYAYKCKHCGHEWFEKRDEERKES